MELIGKCTKCERYVTVTRFQDYTKCPYCGAISASEELVQNAVADDDLYESITEHRKVKENADEESTVIDLLRSMDKRLAELNRNVEQLDNRLSDYQASHRVRSDNEPAEEDDWDDTDDEPYIDTDEYETGEYEDDDECDDEYEEEEDSGESNNELLGGYDDITEDDFRPGRFHYLNDESESRHGRIKQQPEPATANKLLLYTVRYPEEQDVFGDELPMGIVPYSKSVLGIIDAKSLWLTDNVDYGLMMAKKDAQEVQYTSVEPAVSLADLPQEEWKNQQHIYIPADCFNEEKMEGMFQECETLCAVTFGESIKKIPDQMFCNCRNLEYIQFPDSLEMIGVGAFENCRSLLQVHLPEKLQHICKFAFSGCTSLECVTCYPDLTLGSMAFADCVSLKAFVSDNDLFVTREPDQLYDCENTHPGTVKSMVEIISQTKELQTEQEAEVFMSHHHDLFDDKDQIWEEAMAQRLWEDRTVSNFDLAAGCFSGCQALVYADVPVGVAQIGRLAFSGCTALQIVTVPQTTGMIDASAFLNCPSVQPIFYHLAIDHIISSDGQDKKNSPFRLT